MNMTEFSSKPISVSPNYTVFERRTSSVCFETEKRERERERGGWVSLLILKEDENSGSGKATCSRRARRKIRNMR